MELLIFKLVLCFLIGITLGLVLCNFMYRERDGVGFACGKCRRALLMKEMLEFLNTTKFKCPDCGEDFQLGSERVK